MFQPEQVKSDEITYLGNCQICYKKDVQVRMHHLIPQRLMNIIPTRYSKQFEYMKYRVCDKCNRFFHPENMLYAEIKYLKDKINILEDVIHKQSKTIKEMEAQK